MAGVLQVALSVALEKFSFPIDLHRNAAQFAATATPMVLPLDYREMTFDLHPMQKLHSLLTSALRQQQSPDPAPLLRSIPQPLQNALYYQVWNLAAGEEREEENWGERHAADNLPRLIQAVKIVAEQRFEFLARDKKTSIYETMHRMAHFPPISDLNRWGETTLKAETELLIRALHRSSCLDISGQQISWYAGFETLAAVRSTPFHLRRPEPETGQICFINGMATSFQGATERATQLSDLLAQGKNIHCVYSATFGTQTDLTSAALGHARIASHAVLLLLDQWQDFFETSPEGRLLQICTSRGAIEVNNALRHLRPDLRQRILVIAIAPGCLIPSEMGFRVANLVIPSDPVPQIALNRDLLDASHTYILEEHRDGTNPHDMLGPSYQEWLSPRLDAYLRTNDINL